MEAVRGSTEDQFDGPGDMMNRIEIPNEGTVDVLLKVRGAAVRAARLEAGITSQVLAAKLCGWSGHIQWRMEKPGVQEILRSRVRIMRREFRKYHRENNSFQ